MLGHNRYFPYIPKRKTILVLQTLYKFVAQELDCVLVYMESLYYEHAPIINCFVCQRCWALVYIINLFVQFVVKVIRTNNTKLCVSISIHTMHSMLNKCQQTIFKFTILLKSICSAIYKDLQVKYLNKNVLIYFLNQNICLCYSKELVLLGTQNICFI